MLGILLEFTAAGTDRREVLVEHVGGHDLEGAGPLVADLLGELLRRAPHALRGDGQQVRDLRAVLMGS